jgi:uncharacterized protein
MADPIVLLYNYCSQHEDELSNNLRYINSWFRNPGEVWDNISVWDTLVKLEVKYSEKHGSRPGDAITYVIARKGAEIAMKKAVEFKAGLEFRNHHGRTPIFTAAKHNHEASVGMLVRGGCDLNVQDSEGNTPLIWAIKKKRYMMARYLATHTSNLALADNHGKTAWYYAIRGGHHDVIQILIDRGSDIDLNAEIDDGYTPLSYSVFKCCARVAELLIDRGADINILSSNGNSLLETAVGHLHIDMLTLLLSKGMDPNKINSVTGNITFHYACTTNYPLYLELLVNHGADLTLKDAHNFDALYYATEAKCDKTVAFIEATLKLLNK